MKRAFCVLAGVLLLAGLALAQSLRPPVKVAVAPSAVRWSQMAFSPDGVAHIIYELMDYGSSFSDIVMYVTYDGTTASTPIMVSPAVGLADRPGIGIGPTGTVAVVWGDQNTSSVMMRVKNPGTGAWGDIETVKAGYGRDEPSVCVDRENNIYVMWYDDGGGRIYSRAKVDGAWEETKRMDSQTTRATQDCIAMGRDGRIWGVWREKQGDGEYKGRYRWRTKTTGWSEVRIVNDSGASWSHPHMSVGPDNIPLVVTGDIDESSGTSQEMWLITLNLGSNPREMVIPPVTQHYPRVAADKFGKYVACQLGGGDFGDGIRFTYKKGGAWADVQTMGGAWPKLPGISADGYGNVAVCWSNIRFGEGADILLASFGPISKKQVYAPLTPTGSAVFETVNNVPKVTWTFSWGANSQNKDSEMDGYQLYRRFSGGSWEPVAFVDKTKLTATYSVTELPSIPEFAVCAVLLSGLECDKVPFPAIQYQLGTPLNTSASYKLTGLKTTPMLKVDITWQPNSANNDAYVQGYNIYKKDGTTGSFQLYKEIAKGQTSASFTFDTAETKLQFGITTLTVFKLESSMVVLGPTQTQTGSSRSRILVK
jgi:hypothetical protein